MFKILFLILIVMSAAAFAQQTKIDESKEKPKSVLFDEFGKISQKEIKQRAQKLREKLSKRDSANQEMRVYLIFYADAKTATSKETQNLIRDVLLDDCRDCYGIGGNPFVFVDGGKLKKQKTQFWLVPKDAEPPTP